MTRRELIAVSTLFFFSFFLFCFYFILIAENTKRTLQNYMASDLSDVYPASEPAVAPNLVLQARRYI